MLSLAFKMILSHHQQLPINLFHVIVEFLQHFDREIETCPMEWIGKLKGLSEVLFREMRQHSGSAKI